MNYMKTLLVAVSAFLLVACGGGGGSAGSTPNSGGSTGGTGSTGSAASAQLLIANQSGAGVTSISVGGIFSARATIRDALGLPVAGKRVDFVLEGSGIAVLEPSSAVTNEAGVAEVAIAPASLTSKGAASLLATASGPNGESLQASYDFSVSAANLSLSPITVGSASLASGGNTSVQITALVDGLPSTGVPVNVVYTATCGRLNGQDAIAGISVSTDGGGVASANYLAVAADGGLCRDAVTITAKSVGAVARTRDINVAPPVADAITFVGATPARIFVSGSGADEQAQVKFRVLSSTAAPMQGVNVLVSLQINPGGVGIAASNSTDPVELQTDQNGEVAVSVFSGSIPGPVKLRAALVGKPGTFAETQDLTVASGPATQARFSLSVETYSIEGGDIDGVGTKLTVRVADRVGNAVQDGTVVNFTSEGGQVAYSCSTVQVNKIASCSVDFVSQATRPADGRVSVLAFLAGVKDYVDLIGNNKYDAGIDSLANQGDAFRDDNENNQFDAGEFVIPRGGTLACAGNGGSTPARLDTCDSLLSTTVRRQAVILLASSDAVVKAKSFDMGTGVISVGESTETVTVTTGIRFRLASKGKEQLPMPAGTTLSVLVTDQTPDDGLTCAIARQVNNSPVPDVAPGNVSSDLSTEHEVLLAGCRAGDRVQLTVRSPSGKQTLDSLLP